MATKVSILASLALAVGVPLALGQGVTTRVNVSSSGSVGYVQANWCEISADGRYVVFLSDGSGLVAGIPSGGSRVFIHDRLFASTNVVSTRADGWISTGSCYEPAMTPSGAFIAFSYGGGDLDSSDTNNSDDIYVKNWQTNTLSRVSVAATGVQSNNSSHTPKISSDARIVAFVSLADNLLPGDNNGRRDIFIKDRLTSIVTRASVSSSGVEGTGNSWEPTISADGNWIAFRCDSNLGTPFAGSYPTIFLHDRMTLTTVPVVVSQIGQVPNGSAYSPTISGNGRFIAYESNASNLVANDLNSSSDVFVYDRQLGTTIRASVNSLGAEGFGHSYKPSLTADGTSIAFVSEATNLVVGDTWGFQDVFVRNLSSGLTRRASVSSFGDQGNQRSDWARISADGAHVVFISRAANLVPDDWNFADDCFVRSEGCPLPSNYCTAGTSTNGCTPSMSASGTPSVAANSGYLLVANGVEGQKYGYLFYGVSGPSMVPWGLGTSTMCVAAPRQRLSGNTPTGGTIGQCDGTVTTDWLAFLDVNPAALGQAFASGDSVWVQAWYRDPPSPKTTNLSDGLRFVMCP